MMMNNFPNDIKLKAILLFVIAIIFFTSMILIIKNKKKMSVELWISILALCIIGGIGTVMVLVCLLAMFTIAD